MSRTRKRSTAFLIVAAIGFSSIGGCPPIIGFTIAAKTFVFTLGATGVLRALADAAEAVQKGGVVQLPFASIPVDRPGSGWLNLNTGTTRALPLDDTSKPSTAQGVTGTGQLTVYIDDVNASNPCDTGILIGTYSLTFTSGAVTVTDASLALPSAALAHVITGQFTICLKLTATVDVQLEVGEMTVTFGPVDSGDPNDTGDDPNDTGDDPNDTGDDPNDTGDDPNDTGDDPNDPNDVVDPGDGFTIASIIHEGSEQLIAGVDADSSVSLVTPAGYAPTRYKAVAISGDGLRVWFSLYDQFPNVEGDPQTQLWRVNIDGSGGVRSGLPDEHLGYGLTLETTEDGDICYGDNPGPKKMYRATPGSAVTTAFQYYTDAEGWRYGDVRGEFKINNDGTKMVYRSYVNTRIYGVDLPGGSGTPVMLADGSTVAYNGQNSRTFGSRIDLAADGSTFIFVAEYWNSGWTPQLQYAMWVGNGFAPGASFTRKTVPQPGVEVASLLNITDNGANIAYTIDPDYLGAPAPIYLQATAGTSRTAFTDDRTALSFAMSDEGNRFYARTSRQYGNGNSFLIDVADDERVPAGTGLFDDLPGVDSGNIRLSDDGYTMAAGSSRGVWVLRDGEHGLNGFPSIDQIRYRFNDDCSMTVRVTVNAPRGIEILYATPYIDGEPPTSVVEHEDNPTYAFRWGTSAFTLVEGETNVYEQNLRLTNGAGDCAEELLTSEFKIRVVLYDANKTMAVFRDFAPGS